jgi:hypothetical protein
VENEIRGEASSMSTGNGAEISAMKMEECWRASNFSTDRKARWSSLGDDRSATVRKSLRS